MLRDKNGIFNLGKDLKLIEQLRSDLATAQIALTTAHCIATAVAESED